MKNMSYLGLLVISLSLVSFGAQAQVPGLLTGPSKVDTGVTVDTQANTQQANPPAAVAPDLSALQQNPAAVITPAPDAPAVATPNQ